jgi:DNA repair protein RadC
MMIDLPSREDPDAPEARLRRLGVEALSDTELLAMVLGAARPSNTNLSAARALLHTHDGLRGVARAGVGALSRELGDRRAVRVIAAVEIARRAAAVPLTRGVPYRSSRDVVRAFGPRLVDSPDELVIAVVLDARQRPVAERVLARGSASACAVGARQIFALAVREGGAGVLLVHNHPSGDPTPSGEDIEFTRNVIAAGRVLELPIVDHVIVAREGSFSFLDAGILERAEVKP